MFSRRTAMPPEKLSLICCAAIFLGATVLAVSGGQNYLAGFDYRVYLTGGRMVLDGSGANFYDLTHQFQVQRQLWPQMAQQAQLLPYLAPPFVALLFAPLAMVPPLCGYIVWTAINVVLLFCLARGVLAELGEVASRQKTLALVLLLSFAPLLFTVMQGQVSLLVVWAFFQSWRNARAGRDWSAGLWFSLLLIRPQLALAPIMVFIWKGRWRLLGGFAFGAIILGAVSLNLVGVKGLQGYQHLLGAVSGWENIYGVRPQQMQTWRGFSQALLRTDHSNEARVLWLAGVLMAGASLFWCWRGSWQPGATRFDRQWAVAGIVALFCCPYLYAHDLSLLAICGFLLFRASLAENSRLRLLPLFGYGIILLWAILLTLAANTPPLAPLFEAIAILFLGWYDLKNPLNSSLTGTLDL